MKPKPKVKRLTKTQKANDLKRNFAELPYFSVLPALLLTPAEIQFDKVTAGRITKIKAPKKHSCKKYLLPEVPTRISRRILRLQPEILDAKEIREARERIQAALQDSREEAELIFQEALEA